MTLHVYFAKRFATMILMIFGVFTAMVVLLQLIEQLRQFGGGDVAFLDILRLAALSAPEAVYQIVPLILMLATIALFLRLAASSELVVTRAVGRSALRALVAPVVVAALFGIVTVAVFNPIVAGTLSQYERQAGRLTGQEVQALSIVDGSVWLRQGGLSGQTVIRASRANLDGSVLADVDFITFAPDGGVIRRVKAKSAELNDGFWTVRDAKAWPLIPGVNPEQNAVHHDQFLIASPLTRDEIRNSFGAPASIAIWDLPGFISQLERSGFSPRRHQVWLQLELSLPLFLVAMVLLGSAFTLKPQRGGGTGMMVLYAVLLGFGLYFVRNFAKILGENGQIDPLFAAWIPPIGAIGLAIGLLLHREDG